MRPAVWFAACVTVCTAVNAQQWNYYFGNIHSHTGFSDGNKDSTTSGISDPAGSYSYAKQSQDFDFLGISEHNHYSSKGNPGFRKHLYQQGLSMADAANDDGVFVALYGLEYGVSSQYNGHLLIYGMQQVPGWEESVPGMAGPNYDVYNAKSDYTALFGKVKNTPGAFCYLAHPAFDDFTTNGTWETALANAPYNAAFDSVIVGMPLRSGLATNPGSSYSDYPQGNYFNYYKKLLYNGYHIGIGYDHDNHYTNFGRGNGGRLVILAQTLSRASFYDAMHKMRFYGSDDINARITFECNGFVMGAVTGGTAWPSFSVLHSDPDGEEADTIRIWRGSRNSGGLWAEIVKSTTGNNTCAFTDDNMMSDREYFYFAEIRQKDGQWIVTSPIWYTVSKTLGMEDRWYGKAAALFDPVNGMLHCSVGWRSGTSLRITDIRGRTVLQETFDSASATFDLSAFSQGLYLVHLTGDRNASQHKVIVR